MIFNKINFDRYFKILDIRRPLIPDIVTSEINVPNMDGQRSIGKSILNGNIIEVDIEMKSYSKESVRKDIRELASKLFTRDEQPLIFADESDKYYMAKLDGGTPLDHIYLYRMTTLKFKCTNPIAYGNDVLKTVTTTQDVFVNGTYETQPKFTFTITSTRTFITITNVDTGEIVRVNHNFVNGDVLEIDFGAKWKAFKNGINISQDLTIESRFFKLRTGWNKITVNYTATLEYTERWL